MPIRSRKRRISLRLSVISIRLNVTTAQVQSIPQLLSLVLLKPNVSADLYHRATMISVWHATSSVDQPGPIENYCETWLEDDELRRADRFRRATSRNQHVIGRGMARRLLDSKPRGNELAGGESADRPSVGLGRIRFAEETHGKPYVVAPDAAKQPFNVAHTDGLVMCGIGSHAHRLVGVDVERLDRRTDPEIAERYFSKPEIDYLKSLASDASRRNAFLRIWTLKESFIKAIGTGLQTPLADFAFLDIDSETPAIEMLNPQLRSDMCWKFFSIQPRPGYVGAIAVAADDNVIEVELKLNCFDDLIR